MQRQPDRVRGYKRPESVLVLVYTADGEVLLLKRKDRPDFSQSVTGSLKWDESADAAARRELVEETGIDAAPVSTGVVRAFEIVFPWTGRFAPGTTHNQEHEYLIRLPGRVSVVINPREHLEYAWVQWRQAINQVWSWTNREAVEKLAAMETWAC
jgi:dATP pyrophosphohydrolase